ncbi:CBS domain-containing protein [Dactylosporangium roseum]|uniref:CBS domain-containing protein n=1 Tax=Dactylosporangium roseum TaxID=47989 RepID=A0ABY5YZ79_9ACTN|nr:CBS domain-containing protein [Dactylosporangium roseum]UWZ34168.1 CBS domain-containing protein [Dactylosporangium roseum]
MAVTVASRMTAGAVTVDEQADLQEFVDAVERHRVRTVAVVDESGRLLGAVDRDDHPDLFDGSAAHRGPRVAGTPRQRRRRERRTHAPVRELMRDAVAVPGTSPVAEALRVLATSGTELAFVVDDRGVVRGTVSTRQCRSAPAVRIVSEEAGHGQVRV